MWFIAPPAYAPPAYRNRSRARLRFRPVGASSERYPAWVSALVGHSGVYVIRERTARGPRIAYVGESHRGRLYGTLTRHFQSWARYGQVHDVYSAHDPGMTYRRDHCDAAAIVTPADRAVEIQNALIAWLRPRDNIVGALAQRDDDEVAMPSFVDDAEPIPF